MIVFDTKKCWLDYFEAEFSLPSYSRDKFSFLSFSIFPCRSCLTAIIIFVRCLVAFCSVSFSRCDWLRTISSKNERISMQEHLDLESPDQIVDNQKLAFQSVRDFMPALKQISDLAPVLNQVILIQILLKK